MSAVRGKYGSDGVTVSVPADQLEHYSRQGYYVVDVVMVSETIPVREEIPPTQEMVRNGSYYNRAYFDKTVIVQQPRFIMMQDADSEIARMATELANVRESLNATVVTQRTAAEDLKKMTERMTVAELSYKNTLDEKNAIAKRQADLLRANTKLEQDIGKLRTAFGTVKVKEVLDA